MASLTWFATSSLVGGVHQEMSVTDPGAEATASPVTGWIVSTGSTLHSAFLAQVERAASTFVATAPPDGSIDTTNGDCLRSTETHTGSFASANWNVHFAARATTNGGAQDGRMRCRLFRSANADGASATEITAGQQQGGLVSNLATSATQVSTATFNPGVFTVTGEYIFVQLAWERTGAGGMTTADVNMRVGNSAGAGTRVISSEFTPAMTGTGDGALAPFAASGTGAESFTGTGTGALAAFDGSGVGTVVTAVTGSGTGALAAFDATGAGAETFTGSGTAALSPFAGSGVAVELFTGSGGGALAAFAASGAGAEEFTGTGTAALAAFGASGEGTVVTAVTGSGGGALAAFGGSGVGSEELTGTGAAAMAPFGASGVGEVVSDSSVSGSGSGALASFGGSGTGAEELTGSGGGAMASFGADGAGSAAVAAPAPQPRGGGGRRVKGIDLPRWRAQPISAEGLCVAPPLDDPTCTGDATVERATVRAALRAVTMALKAPTCRGSAELTPVVLMADGDQMVASLRAPVQSEGRWFSVDTAARPELLARIRFLARRRASLR